MTLTQGAISIRLLTEQDIPVMSRWLSDPQVLEWYEGRDNPHDEEGIRSHYFDRDPAVNRCIISFEGRPAGYLQYYQLSDEDLEEYSCPDPGSPVYGLDQFIGEPSLWGRGIGQRFITMMLAYLTETMGAGAVILDPHTDNLRAIACYEKCGFQKVTLLPSHELHEGKYVDCWLMRYQPAK